MNLKIKFDGPDAIKQHRLSISAFGESLTLLLKAYRRIASASLEQAFGDSIKGRLRKEAESLDLEIARIEDGSIGIDIECTSKIQQQDFLLAQIEEESLDTLLSNIEKESRGIAVDIGVKRFLASLKGKVEKQNYCVYKDGSLTKEITISSMGLRENQASPHLCHLVGHVVGVGFDPGQRSVRIKAEDGKTTMTGEANEEQVEKALSHRSVLIQALFVVSKEKTRILWIKEIEQKANEMSENERTEAIFDRWDEVFRRLAR